MIPKIAPITTDLTVNSAILISGATNGLNWDGWSGIAVNLSGKINKKKWNFSTPAIA